MATTTYYGEVGCPTILPSGKECKNKAYWLVTSEGRLSCGVHARDPETRAPLPKRSLAEKNKLASVKYARETIEIDTAAEDNLSEGRKGHVIVTKLRMMAAPEDHSGYRKVFPNFKHGNRKDGLGMPELSPMSLGPVKHTQPDLPEALNIENLHQFNKVFPSEIDDDGNPTEEWYATRVRAYRDPIPHRHKPAAKSASGSKNIPEYSIWVTPDGKEAKLSYFESRQVYCTYYERLAKKTKAYATLVKLREKGVNIQIVGYDGYDLGIGSDDNHKMIRSKFIELYNDTKKPFGHELVLAALLLIENRKDYPWRGYTTLEL